MNNNKWITDRLPTEEDADSCGYVWVTEKNGNVCHMMWDCVVDEPWMHFTRPEPYVKPKRVRVVQEQRYDDDGFEYAVTVGIGTVARHIPTREAAEEIAAIYERVMP